MLEVGRILGCLSAVLLVAAIAAWVKLLRSPTLQPLDGRVETNSGQGEIASQLLLLAVSLSALAAVLAIGDWFAR